LRVRPYMWYAERTKIRYDAVDRSFCDAIHFCCSATRGRPVGAAVLTS
jgi:hypothetical protein